MCYQRLARQRRGAKPDYAKREARRHPRPYVRWTLPHDKAARAQRLLDDLGHGPYSVSSVETVSNKPSMILHLPCIGRGHGPNV